MDVMGWYRLGMNHITRMIGKGCVSSCVSHIACDNKVCATYMQLCNGNVMVSPWTVVKRIYIYIYGIGNMSWYV